MVSWYVPMMCKNSTLQKPTHVLILWRDIIQSYMKYKLQQLALMYLSSMNIPSNIIILLSSTTKYHLFRPVQWQCLTSKKYRKVYEHLSILAAVFFVLPIFFFCARCFLCSTRYTTASQPRIQATFLFPPHGGKNLLLGGLTFPHSWGGQGWEGMCIQHPWQYHFNIAGIRSWWFQSFWIIFHIQYIYI